MHIYFSGIGGTAIGPLAMIAKQAGYEVSGSDKQDSQYIENLRKKGIDTIHIGQTKAQIAEVHERKPIDWVVYSSALTLENPNPAELEFAKEQNIQFSKRDALLNKIIDDKKLKLIAVAGTHGKTTTTAMVVWLFKQLGIPISYSVGAKISFGEMGEYDPASEFFVYECDEFDRNFLEFSPHTSLITGVTYDHHEIFPTQEDYSQAFRDFINQSQTTFIWQDDADRHDITASEHVAVMRTEDYEYILNPQFLTDEIDRKAMATIRGYTNRLDAGLAAQGVMHATQQDDMMHIVRAFDGFPGLQRRMEQIAPNLYTDYAHTPEKIRGAMSVATEIAAEHSQNLVIVYEPLTNRRQHYMKDAYGDCFEGAKKLYWVPSYLAREDPAQRILTPSELISHISNPEIAQPAELDEGLRAAIEQHINIGDMVVAMTGGGGNSLDEWLRKEFA